jgi:hypothetical protein
MRYEEGTRYGLLIGQGVHERVLQRRRLLQRGLHGSVSGVRLRGRLWSQGVGRASGYPYGLQWLRYMRRLLQRQLRLLLLPHVRHHVWDRRVFL